MKTSQYLQTNHSNLVKLWNEREALDGELARNWFDNAFLGALSGLVPPDLWN